MFLKAGAEREFTWLASDGIGSLGLQGLMGVEEAALGKKLFMSMLDNASVVTLDQSATIGAGAPGGYSRHRKSPQCA